VTGAPAPLGVAEGGPPEGAPEGSSRPPAVPPRALGGRRLVRRFRRSRPAVAGLVIAATFVLAALFAPLLAPADPAATDFDQALRPPSLEHWLGTDDLGRDQLSRVLYGLRASLEVGLLAVGISVAVAVPLGLSAGYYRKGWDPIVSRFTDTLLAFPFLVLAVGLAAILGPSLLNAAIAIGIAEIPLVLRVVRGETISLREEDYVEAAVANGASDLVILARHILPNALSVLIVQATVAIPIAIINEAVLSFLGLGVQPPTPSLGVMLSGAQQFISQAPWMAVFPGLAIVLAALSFNLLGDGLRDALDPRAWR
jgi:peptide/nickel transport system permease protein